jgi:hypothetical protein
MDTKICATPYELCSFKLSPVFCKDLPGHTEFVYDTPQEFDRCFLCDVYYWHCLHPLGEGVDYNK